MLHVIQTFGDELPAACQNSCEDAWSIFDRFLTKYGSDYGICERTTRVLRHGLTLFGNAALPIAASVIARLSAGFDTTGFPSNLWIAGKVIQRFGNEDSPSLRRAFQEAYEHATQKVVSLLQVKSPGELPDGKLNFILQRAVPHANFSCRFYLVLEDYIHLLLELVTHAPDIFFQSSAFPLAFRASMAALTLVHSEIVFQCLDLFRIVLTHDSLRPDLPQPPKFPIYATTIRSVVDKEGFALVGYLLAGLVGDFPEDSTSTVVSIFRVLAVLWTSQLLSWLPPVLEQLPTTAAPNQTKSQFLQDVTRSAFSFR
jgi:transportin-3